MKRKRIIPAISLLFVGIILAAIRKETVGSPDKGTFSPVPTVLSQKKIPGSTPTTRIPDATRKKKQSIPKKEALISDSSFYLQILQTDGTLDQYHVCSDKIPVEYVDEIIRSTNYVYYCLTSSRTLYRIPIQQQDDKIKLLPENIESVGTIESTDFIYATDQYVIYEGNNCLVQLNVQTGYKRKLPAPNEEDESLYWDFIYDCNKKLIIDRESNLYVVETNGKTNKSIFYKINTETWQKSKLSDNTNAVLLDSSGQIVWMESDEQWNYAYYPETGKRFRCGPNMVRKWADKKDAHEFVAENKGAYFLPIATNRDLADWIQKETPWSYQQKNGHFECMNQFIYKNRMYVKVYFRWTEPEDVNEDEDLTTYTMGIMLFSYSVKNYKGIRPEEHINKTMQNTSEESYSGSDDGVCWEGGTNAVTGDFTFLFGDTLVFVHDQYDSKNTHYGLYNLRTHQYKRVKKKNGDSKYLDWLH